MLQLHNSLQGIVVTVQERSGTILQAGYPVLVALGKSWICLRARSEEPR